MHPRNPSSTPPNQSRSAKPAGTITSSPSPADFRTPPPPPSNLHSARQPSSPTSRAFLHWRLSDDGPGASRIVPIGRHPKPFTNSEVGARRREVRFAPKNRHRRTRWPGLHPANLSRDGPDPEDLFVRQVRRACYSGSWCTVPRLEVSAQVRDVVWMAAGEVNLRRPSRPPRSSSMRHDDVLRPASERMKLSHYPRELPWLLGPRIPGTFHLNKKEYHRRDELSLERPRHFAASKRRRSSRNKN
jgi:hypothetical protein